MVFFLPHKYFKFHLFICNEPVDYTGKGQFLRNSAPAHGISFNLLMLVLTCIFFTGFIDKTFGS